MVKPRRRSVWTRPGYRRLWAARTASAWGDAFATVALSLLVLRTSRSRSTVSGWGSRACYDASIVDNGRVATHANETTRLLGPLGAEVMEVLWSAREPLTVRTVLDRLNRSRSEPLAYTTVMTVLNRLTERGAAQRAEAGRGFSYAPAVKDAAELAVRDVVREHGEAAIAHFVDQARTDPQLRERLQRLLDRDGETGT